MPNRSRRTAACLALLLLAAACAEQGSVQIPAAIQNVGAAGPVTVAVGESAELAVACLDAFGRVIRGARSTWGVLDIWGADERPGRLTLAARGARARLRGVSEGTVFILSGCVSAEEFRQAQAFGWWSASPRYTSFRADVVGASASAWSLDIGPDTLRLRAPTEEDSLTSVAQLLTLRGGEGVAPALDPAGFAWRSLDTTVATVRSDGLVRAVGVGATSVEVSRGGRSASVAVRVDSAATAASWDIALVDAHWTQGAQDPEQRIPIVRNGRAAAVNVKAFATAGAPAATVYLDVHNAAGERIWRDSTALAPATTAAPSFAEPSAQFLVPRPVLRAADSWRVWLGSSVGADAVPGNNAWPRTGRATLRALTAPPLELRLVPLRLAGNNNAEQTLSPADLVYYDSIARIRLPIADVILRVEPPLTIRSRVRTQAELQADPRADAELWDEILPAVDRRRLLSGSGRSAYWIGVIPKPAADSWTRWAGIAYVPWSATDVGPMSRSMVVRGHGWYPSPVSTGNTVAHELGHNLGLRHAPCGNAGWADPAYPVPGGGVGAWVHWVSAWEHGTATSAALVPPEQGELMSYCPGNFVSPFHTRAILEWRALASAASLVMPATPTRVLALRGRLAATGIVLGRAEITEDEPVLEDNGQVLVEVLDSDGRALVRGYARTGRLAESEDIPFVAQVPLSAAAAEAAVTVRVSRGTARATAAIERAP